MVVQFACRDDILTCRQRHRQDGGSNIMTEHEPTVVLAACSSKKQLTSCGAEAVDVEWEIVILLTDCLWCTCVTSAYKVWKGKQRLCRNSVQDTHRRPPTDRGFSTTCLSAVDFANDTTAQSLPTAVKAMWFKVPIDRAAFSFYTCATNWPQLIFVDNKSCVECAYVEQLSQKSNTNTSRHTNRS